MFVTRNGGKAWHDLGPLPATAGSLYGLSLDGGGGLLIGDARGEPTWGYRMRPGTITWTPLPGQSGGPVTALAFLDRQRGIAFIDQGPMLETDDGGRHWGPAAASFVGAVDSLHFLPGGPGWLVQA